jgi:hypothetical protein
MMTSDEELTEEERVEYEKGILTWGKVKNWRFWIRKEWIWYYLAFVLIVVVVALMTFFHKSVSPPLHHRPPPPEPHHQSSRIRLMWGRSSIG